MTPIDLPEDLLVVIFSKVPAISLARFRTTCKGWNTLIRDGRLAKKHYANAPKQSLVILLNKFRVCLLSVNLCGVHNNIAPSVKITSHLRLKDSLSSSSEEVEIHDVFHCEGLLLCTTKDNRRVVWNPCTGKTMWIQPRNSYKDSDYYTIGYDKKSSCYKILRMDTFHIEYEVYDFSSNSWKNIHETRDWSISQMWNHVSVNGNTYWLSLSKEDPISGIILLSFDFSTERFLTVSLPEDPKGHFNHGDVALSVTREGQQLCMLATQVFEFTVTNIWVATKSENTGAMSWSKFLTVSGRDACYRRQPNYRMSFLVDQENKVVLSCNNNRFSNNRIHIVGEDKYIEVYHTDKSSIPILLSYVPSFVQI
ncbi:hypothetical protein Bca52824_019146 [Brassica carinata]|uniref:F-box domain-containing protein n=1 Tax=Brassica carinata TaxID=52824 RepID=A0A8X7VR86_BRACI|nr:hypothetical protein Bca52824_019146 [Brassica carinata]